MRLTKLRHRLWAALAVSVSALLAVGPPSVYACALDDAQAYQASSQEVSLAMEQTALSQLGDGYPTFPQLEMGYPDATSLVSAPAPCLLLKAIGYTEGMWEQAWGSVPVGASGPTKQSASCGYGIMQITSGMRNPNELPLETQLRIAGDYRFNIAWGTNILAEKWNTGDLLDAVVGDRDPSVAEHWYYAVWAYNQFNFKNNPNNPDYPWPRPEYDGSQSRLDYPYQEIVWGYAAHPPEVDDLPLWEGVPLTLPDRAAIGMTPEPIAAPSETHSAACRTLYTNPSVVSVQAQTGSVLTSQAVTLFSATGPGPLQWRAEVEGASWLAVIPSSGNALPAQVLLNIYPQRLTAGTRQATVIFKGPRDVTAATLIVEVRVGGGSSVQYFPYLPRRALSPGQ